jgi:molybdenum cofactor cytidylyltransferase
LFDRSHFDALADVSGDRGGREILRSGEGVALVETGDPGVRRDVDTRADLSGSAE